jgi:hypothetical protein
MKRTTDGNHSSLGADWGNLRRIRQEFIRNEQSCVANRGCPFFDIAAIGKVCLAMAGVDSCGSLGVAESARNVTADVKGVLLAAACPIEQLSAWLIPHLMLGGKISSSHFEWIVQIHGVFRVECQQVP